MLQLETHRKLTQAPGCAPVPSRTSQASPLGPDKSGDTTTAPPYPPLLPAPSAPPYPRPRIRRQTHPTQRLEQQEGVVQTTASPEGGSSTAQTASPRCCRADPATQIGGCNRCVIAGAADGDGPPPNTDSNELTRSRPHGGPTSRPTLIALHCPEGRASRLAPDANFNELTRSRPHGGPTIRFTSVASHCPAGRARRLDASQAWPAARPAAQVEAARTKPPPSQPYPLPRRRPMGRARQRTGESGGHEKGPARMSGALGKNPAIPTFSQMQYHRQHSFYDRVRNGNGYGQVPMVAGKAFDCPSRLMAATDPSNQ